jgi:hypothetical protein
MSLEDNAVKPKKLIVVLSRRATGRGAHRKTDFRHTGLASTGPYDMDAANEG